MEKENYYKAFLELSRMPKESIVDLNLKSLKSFKDNLNIDSTLLTIKDIPYRSDLNSKTVENIYSVVESFKDLIGSFEFRNTINDALVNLSVNSLLQISTAYQTDMMKELTNCFVNANYEKLVSVINKSLNNSIIHAPDIAFLKTSDLTKVLWDEIQYPTGLKTSLKELNKSTAFDIDQSGDLKYIIKDNRFYSDNGNANSKELNVLCSARFIINEMTGELFSESELIDFNSILDATPTLALDTETGKRIKELINYLFNSEELKIDFDRERFYHSRSRKVDEMPYTLDLMQKAPQGLPGVGRYNQIGKAYFYFSDRQIGAENEIKKHFNQSDSQIIQTVMIKPRKSVKLLDLSGTLKRGETFLKYLRYDVSDKNSKMPREYLLPNFVSDCCRKVGFEGIKYYGTKEYFNYVVWKDGYFDFVKMI